MDLEAMKATFLAKGGAVTVVPEGEGAGLTNADWREAMQSPGRINARKLGNDIERESEEHMQRIREEHSYYKS